MGCDALPGGIKNLGVTKIDRWLQENDERKLLGFLSNKGKRDEELYKTIAMAMLYEPGGCVDAETGERVEPEFSYMHQPPQSLPRYLKHYAPEGHPVHDGPEISICVGPTAASRSHQFLSAECVYYCHSCNAILCKFCCVESLYDGNRRCPSSFNAQIAC
jgi:hypothetical protein